MIHSRLLDHPTFPCGGGSRAFAQAMEQKANEICVDPVGMTLPLLVQKPVNHLRRGRWGEVVFSAKNRSRRCRAGLVAVNEMAIMLILMTSLFWLGSQFVQSVTNDPASPSTKSSGLSERGVYRISLDHTGERLWVYRPREDIAQLNLTTGHVEQSLPLVGPELSAVATSRDGSTTLLCSADGTVVLHRKSEIVTMARVALKNDMINEAALSHDGTVAVCMTSAGRVHVWSGQSEVQEFSYDFPEDSVPMRISLNRSGRRLYAAKCDGTVSIHNPETGILETCVLLATGDAAPNYATFIVSEDEHLIALAKSSGELQVFDVSKGAMTRDQFPETRHMSSDVTALSFSPDGRWIAAASHISTEIHVWNLKTGAPVERLSGHNGIVRCLQFAPTSDRLYSGSYDGTIREWSMETCSQMRIVD